MRSIMQTPVQYYLKWPLKRFAGHFDLSGRGSNQQKVLVDIVLTSKTLNLIIEMNFNHQLHYANQSRNICI